MIGETYVSPTGHAGVEIVMHQSIPSTNIPPGQPPGNPRGFPQLSARVPGFVPSEFPGGPPGVEPITLCQSTKLPVNDA